MRLPASSIVARRLSAWLLSAFVAFLAVPAYAQTEVPSNWPLKPPGLNVGDEFRLLFMGKNSRNADSTDIAVYDLYVQGRIADIGHADIKAYASHFKVLGSTATVNARTHTGTTGTGGVTDLLAGRPESRGQLRRLLRRQLERQGRCDTGGWHVA